MVIDSLGSGGAQRQFVLLAGVLVARGHHVDVFNYYPRHDFYRSQLQLLGITVFGHEKGHRFDLGPIRALRRQLQVGKYDGAIAFLRTPSLYLLAARGLAAAPPLAVSERSSSRTGRFNLQQRVGFGFYRLANAIVPNSYLAADQIGRSFPGLRDRLHVIPNGVDLEHFRAIPPQSREADMPLRLLVAARMGPEKDALTVLDAMVLLQQRGMKIPHVTWMGADDPSNAGQAYAKAVEQRIATHDLGAHWSRIPAQPNVCERLAQCHAALLPSLYEGTPNFVCEALACGRPVIASSVGDIPRLLGKSGAGFTFPAQDADALAAAMEQVEGLGAERYAELSNSARTFAEQELSVARYGDQWLVLLNGFKETA